MCGQGTPHAVLTLLSAPLCCRTTGLKIGRAVAGLPGTSGDTSANDGLYSVLWHPHTACLLGLCVLVVTYLHAKRAAQPLRQGAIAVGVWRAAITAAATRWCWVSGLQPLWHLLRNM